MGDDTRAVRVVTVPYDAGGRGIRMGAGPLALNAMGLGSRLAAAGYDVIETRVGLPAGEWDAELHAGFTLHAMVADEMAKAGRNGQFPVLLSGNCNTMIGSVAALQRRNQSVGVFWFDAHADFHTPETDVFGSLDCQGLSMLTGRCWSVLTAETSQLVPVVDENVALIGARWIDDAERAALAQSNVIVVGPADLAQGASFSHALRTVTEGTDTLHVHVDLDVHDPSIAPANAYAAEGGLKEGQIAAIIEEVAHGRVGSLSIASYDPAFDPETVLARAALDLIERLVMLSS